MIGFNVMRYQSFGNWLYHSWLYTQKYNYFLCVQWLQQKKAKKTFNYRFFAFSFMTILTHLNYLPNIRNLILVKTFLVYIGKSACIIQP